MFFFSKITVPCTSFFHDSLQRLIGAKLFPPGQGDWYALQKFAREGDNNSPFEHFIAEQRASEEAKYHQQFKNLEFALEHIEFTLADESQESLELFHCIPEDELFNNSSTATPAGVGKHIIYFTGMATYYQNCLTDITTAAKETGATIHAFNYPGASSSTGHVKEANDLINAGIAVVNSLLVRGVHPDKIILQGDSFGAAIGYRVKTEFKKQAGIDLRIIMNNTFKSFKSVINDKLASVPQRLRPNVKGVLTYAGWHVTPGKEYKFSGPYQCHIQHDGDQTLSASSTLSGKVMKYTIEATTGSTTSKKRSALKDPCPEEYLASREQLDAKHIVHIKAEARVRLEKKYKGQIDTHMADLCDMEIAGGGSVYTNFICEFIEASDRYINNGHQQVFDPLTSILPSPLVGQQKITVREHDPEQTSVAPAP